MKIKLFLIALSLSITSFTAHAQLAAANYRSPVPLSPQAAELFKFINIPVDYSRGLVPISIPIYTIKAGDLELPITLQYHSSGIKVHEPSSIVGLGWSFQAEPQLSRIVNGLPDESGFLVNAQLGNNTNPYLYSLAQGYEDEQPDEFAFSLLNTSGKFFYSRKPGTLDHSIKTVPYVPVKVEDSNNNFWRLTDDRGTQYSFGRTTDLIEMDNLFKISSWKATQIVNANHTDTISFSYYAKDSELLMYRSLPVETYIIKDSTSLDYANSSGDQMALGCNGWITPNDIEQAKIHVTRPSTIPSLSQEYSYEDPQNPFMIGSAFAGQSSVSPIQVEILTVNEIKFRGGKVVIEKGPVPNTQFSNKAINRIVVYNDLGEVIKEVRFTYQEISASSSSGASTFSQGRIFLKRLTVVADGKEEFYSFDYENISSLPYYNTKDVDLWDYYNGPNGNTELMQPTTIHLRRLGGIGTSGNVNQNITLGTANRQPSLAYATAGTLTKITYPTGGSSYFAYELNQAIDDMTNQPHNIGGLRIKGIYEDGGSYRTFKYGRNENGGGMIKNWIFGNSPYNPFVYEDFRYEKVPLIGYNPSSQCYEFTEPIPVNYRYRTLSSQPIFDNTYKGVNVVYPEVAEYFSNNENGKVVYKYAIGSMGNSPYASPFYINGTTLSIEDGREWMYGHQLSTTTFKGNGGYERIQHKSSLQLPEIYADTIWSRKVYTTTKYLSDVYNMDVQMNEFYYPLKNDIRTGFIKLVADTTIEYASAGTASVIKQYNYTNPDLPFPTEEILISSDNSIKKTKKYFASDLLGTESVFAYMVSRNQLTVPIIEEFYVGNTLRQKNTTTYLYGWNNQTLILPSVIKSQTIGFPEETRIEFLKYDGYGNPLQVRKEGILNTSYIYSYKNRYPVAEISNTDYASLQSLLGVQGLESFGNSTPSDQQVDSFLGSLRSSLPSSQVSTFSYRPLIGLSTSMDPKGMKTSYSYDGFGRLKTVKDHRGQVVKALDYHFMNQ
jgi:YD repeat-containing protein